MMTESDDGVFIWYCTHKRMDNIQFKFRQEIIQKRIHRINNRNIWRPKNFWNRYDKLTIAQITIFNTFQVATNVH